MEDSKKEDKKAEQSPERNDLIKSTVERVLSKDNLRKEPTLVSNMNPQMYLPISSLFNLGAISELNTTPEEVAKALEASGSEKVSLDSTKTMVKPNLPEFHQRRTLIVRDVDSKSLSAEDFKNEVLKDAPCDKDAIIDIKPDVNDHWYVRFNTEDACEDVALWLRNQKYNDKPIHTAVKAEHFMLTLFPDLDKQPAAPRTPTSALGYGKPSGSQGYNNYNPYAGVDEFGYYHGKGGKGKGKGRKGKGKGKGKRGMNGPLEQYGSRISVVEVDSAVVSYGLRQPETEFGAAPVSAVDVDSAIVSYSLSSPPPVVEHKSPAAPPASLPETEKEIKEKYPDITGDETKYAFDYRKYSRSEIEAICDAVKTSDIYKPDGMVKIEKQLGEGVFRKTPNREWFHPARKASKSEEPKAAA